MSALLLLTSGDFQVQKGQKGDIMCHGIPGFSLILFYSTHCVHCQNLTPIFKKLPGTITGCQFGMINVSTNGACIAMSKNTIAPIKFVPYLVLYVNGKPYMIYQGPHDINEIKRFVFEVGNSFDKRQKFSSNPKDKEVNKGSVNKQHESGCTEGIPIYGDNSDQVCYLENQEAYPTTR
jgi:hypothetical protein